MSKRQQADYTVLSRHLSITEAEAQGALAALEAAGFTITRTPQKRVSQEQVSEVWEAYLHHHPTATLTAGRRRLIGSRLRDGFGVGILVDAIHGNHRSPWHCGANREGKQYHDLGLILRDADTVERFAAEGVESAPAAKLAAGGKLNARDLARIALEGGDSGDAPRIGGFAELVRPQLAAGG